MKIDKRNKKSKKRLFITLLTLVLVIFALLFFYIFVYRGSIFGWSPYGLAKNSKINYGNPSDEQKTAGTNIKLGNNTSNSAKNDNDQVVQSKPSSDKKLAATVTIVGSNQNANGDLNIRAVADVIEPNSTCILKIYKSNQEVYSEAVATSPQPSYSACSGFTVLDGLLGDKPSSIKIVVSYAGSLYEGNASKELSIK